MLPNMEVEEAGDSEVPRSQSPDTDIEMSDFTQLSEGVVRAFLIVKTKA